MPPFLEALRPHQWVKNLLVLTPLLFTTKDKVGLEIDHFRDGASWISALLAFAAFCLAASSIYLLNDLVDREEDAHHPKKRHRPIASGRLSVGTAK
ncbi:MAG: UbiA family prenyltransferase, partial [Planctomycetota bacterium]|nr:UbiA family prenyltransferase [Planctomycetota bacterium]